MVVACVVSMSNGDDMGKDEFKVLMRKMPIKGSNQQRPSKTYRAIIKPILSLKLSSTM